ncbi:MAG TPA: hypothetical protein EYP71_06800 [Dehalococcoidia bacterium]|nr:hypothetical protein [Dehalococcoidia bacterium]
MAHQQEGLSLNSSCLELEATNINLIASRAITQALPLIRSHNQSLTLNLTPRLPKIAADPLRIEQVLLNLISNAVNLTPNGGNISISAYERQGFVLVSITDSGTTIPPEKRQEIFKPHCYLEDNRGQQIPEIGLGLSLCRYFVELHGGTIWLETKGRSKGNTFTFALPLHPRT